ncbi:sensor histidine kinase [Arenimonas sp.]|uniref:sensor histidine kinase n=1 Tax=Arenimonas sp. TaxID=1872635 RepID=UPI0039E6354D
MTSDQEKTGKNLGVRDAQDLHATPWFGLSYLLFPCVPLLFSSRTSSSAVIATAVAVVLFIPAYFLSYRYNDLRNLWLSLFVAAIGFALLPFNPGGNTFLIYAMAMAAVALSVRTTILLCGAYLLLMIGECLLLAWPKTFAFGSLAITAVIGTMVVAGILFSRARATRNAELRLTQDEVRRLATVAERERIGRDLHDLLGHTLSVVALKSELAGKLLDRDPAAAREQIREVEAVARQALTQVREAVAGTRAAEFEAEVAAARLALLSADIRFDHRLAPIELDGKLEQALAMALREAVTNILRHASARRVDVELGRRDDRIVLTIADDGRGGVARQGNGLQGMRERIAAIGGSLEIESPSGGGTRLSIAAPGGQSA